MANKPVAIWLESTEAQQPKLKWLEKKKKILSSNLDAEGLQTDQSRTGLMHGKSQQLSWENFTDRISRPTWLLRDHKTNQSRTGLNDKAQ